MRTPLSLPTHALVSRRRQTGATLIVGLVLLLVLTVVGVSGMNTATMEITMAANTQFQQDAFQLAEDGIDIDDSRLRTVKRRRILGALHFDGEPFPQREFAVHEISEPRDWCAGASSSWIRAGETLLVEHKRNVRRSEPRAINDINLEKAVRDCLVKDLCTRKLDEQVRGRWGRRPGRLRKKHAA